MSQQKLPPITSPIRQGYDSAFSLSNVLGPQVGLQVPRSDSRSPLLGLVSFCPRCFVNQLKTRMFSGSACSFFGSDGGPPPEVLRIPAKVSSRSALHSAAAPWGVAPIVLPVWKMLASSFVTPSLGCPCIPCRTLHFLSLSTAPCPQVGTQRENPTRTRCHPADSP